MKIELAKTEVVHFVGIGGIGMSGLSLIMKGMGFNIQGSDIFNNKNIAPCLHFGCFPIPLFVLLKNNNGNVF